MGFENIVENVKMWEMFYTSEKWNRTEEKRTAKLKRNEKKYHFFN